MSFLNMLPSVSLFYQYPSPNHCHFLPQLSKLISLLMPYSEAVRAFSEALWCSTDNFQNLHFDLQALQNLGPTHCLALSPPDFTIYIPTFATLFQILQCSELLSILRLSLFFNALSEAMAHSLSLTITFLESSLCYPPRSGQMLYVPYTNAPIYVYVCVCVCIYIYIYLCAPYTMITICYFLKVYYSHLLCSV